MSDSDDGDDVDDGRPVLGAFQLPLLAAGQAESSDDEGDDDAAPVGGGAASSPQNAPSGSSGAADEPAEDVPAEASLLPSAEDALEDDGSSHGAFLKVSHSVDVPAMQGFEDPSDAAARKPLTGAEKAALYTENAAKCLAARDQAPSANRKRKPGSEAVDGGHFRSEANARKNAGKLKGEFKKRPERQRER